MLRVGDTMSYWCCEADFGGHTDACLLRTMRAKRITALVEKPRCLTVEAATAVVDAAMFGIGCTEGVVREEQQRRIDAGEKL